MGSDWSEIGKEADEDGAYLQAVWEGSKQYDAMPPPHRLRHRCGCQGTCKDRRCGCHKRDIPCLPACGCGGADAATCRNPASRRAKGTDSSGDERKTNGKAKPGPQVALRTKFQAQTQPRARAKAKAGAGAGAGAGTKAKPQVKESHWHGRPHAAPAAPKSTRDGAARLEPLRIASALADTTGFVRGFPGLHDVAPAPGPGAKRKTIGSLYPTWVAFINKVAHNGPFKVGITNNPKRRSTDVGRKSADGSYDLSYKQMMRWTPAQGPNTRACIGHMVLLARFQTGEAAGGMEAALIHAARYHSTCLNKQPGDDGRRPHSVYLYVVCFIAEWQQRLLL